MACPCRCQAAAAGITCPDERGVENDPAAALSGHIQAGDPTARLPEVGKYENYVARPGTLPNHEASRYFDVSLFGHMTQRKLVAGPGNSSPAVAGLTVLAGTRIASPSCPAWNA